MLLQSWTKGWRQIEEIKRNSFSMEWFAADFLQFFTNKYQNLAFGWTTGYSPSSPKSFGNSCTDFLVIII